MDINEFKQARISKHSSKQGPYLSVQWRGAGYASGHYSAK